MFSLITANGDVIRATPWRCRGWASETRRSYAIQANRCHSRLGVRKVGTSCWLRGPCTPCTSSPRAVDDSPPTQEVTATAAVLEGRCEALVIQPEVSEKCQAHLETDSRTNNLHRHRESAILQHTLVTWVYNNNWPILFSKLISVYLKFSHFPERTSYMYSHLPDTEATLILLYKPSNASSRPSYFPHTSTFSTFEVSYKNAQYKSTDIMTILLQLRVNVTAFYAQTTIVTRSIIGMPNFNQTWLLLNISFRCSRSRICWR